MRQFTAGNGTNSTAAVLAYLGTANQLFLADLIMIGPIEAPAVMLTNWNSPLNWPVYGTFQPSTISRGTVTSQVGLKVDSLSFSWSPPVGVFGTTGSTANPYQQAQAGFYDNMDFRMWRCVMPTPGDANTYGACQWFGGRVADTTVERAKVTFTINSWLDVLNQQVPPNLIEVNNTLANYAGATPVVADAETAIAQFQVEFPSGTFGSPPNPVINNGQSIWATCLSPTASKNYSLNKFQFGYIVFNPGSSLAGYWSVVSNSGPGSPSSGGTYNHFLTLGQFPFSPQAGDTFYVATKPPINLQDAVAGFEYFGFPYVPQPESAA